MKLPLEKINEAIKAISNSIDQDEWAEALFGCEIILNELDKHDTNSIVLQLYFNIASQFIDSGSFLKNEIAVRKGIQILEQNYEHYKKEYGNNLFYNLANAKISIANNFGYKNDLINNKESQLYSEAKNLYWQVFKTIDKESEPNLYHQNLINLANTLKQQYRFSEAIYIYERIAQTKLDYPEAFINRSTCLENFDRFLDHRSEKMIQEIIKGYEFAYLSTFTPTSYKQYYLDKIEFLKSKMSILDDDKNKKLDELAEMSEFRQWCIKENLTLNIHGMYCSCIANERDNLTLLEGVISSENILQFEQYLNRIKAEFSLIRVLYYESKFTDSSKFDYESYYSELNDQEIINITRITDKKTA